MKLVAVRILGILVSYVLSYLLSWYFGTLYFAVFPNLLGGGFFSDNAARSLVGLPLALIFLATLILTTIGRKHKYWWIGIALIPAILFEIAVDPIHIYFPIALGVVGWAAGLGVHKLLRLYTPGLLTRLE